MKESIFDKDFSEEIISRIEKLSPETAGKWGRMTVSQMLKHCQQPLRVAMGDLKLKQNWIGFLFGKMAKRKFISTMSMGKNLPTDKNFIVLNNPNFENEKAALVEMLRMFAEKGAEIITKEPHPFFGKMSIEEWDNLQVIHLKHHLNQFGV
ncbi:MAG: DUF1569 domain-containing protein [Saprospiraceae bacterium]